MKEKIYTIPVNDAYRSDCGCPLCALHQEIETGALNYYLGPSLMEPDTRKATNSKGFCYPHLKKLYAQEKNRLGLGLMLHTHFQDLDRDLAAALEASAPGSGSFLKGRDKDYKKRLLDMADRIEGRMQSCIICNKINFTMERYGDVLFWLYFEDKGFQTVFQSKIHCFPHVAFLLRGAAKYLSQNQAAEFTAQLARQHNEQTKILIEDLEWFTRKFDYINEDKPWGNSVDAVPRGIERMAGTEKG